MTDRSEEIGAAAFGEEKVAQGDVPKPAPLTGGIPPQQNFLAVLDALRQAQLEFLPIKATTEGRTGNQTYKYAPLPELHRCTRPALSKYGLVIFHVPHVMGTSVLVETILALPRQSAWLTVPVSVTTSDDTPKATGSGITYASRYGYRTACGLADEDDDGTAASERDEDRPTTKQDLVQSEPPPSDGQLYVVKVETKSGTKNGKKWTRFTVTFSDGQYGSTFDGKLATACEVFRDRRAPVDAQFKEDGKFTNLVSCVSAAQTYTVERVAGKKDREGNEGPPFRIFVTGDERIYLTHDAAVADEAAAGGTATWRAVEKAIETSEGTKTIYEVEEFRSVPF